jgi:hypothetical protein
MTEKEWRKVPLRNAQKKPVGLVSNNNPKKLTEQQKEKKRAKSPTNKDWNDGLYLFGLAVASELHLWGTPVKIAFHQALLDYLGLYRFKVKDDGSCGFRSISVFLSGSPDNHQNLRITAVDWLSKNPVECMDKVTRDDDQTQEEAWDTRLETYRTPGQWADHLLLVGLAGANKLSIHVLPCEAGEEVTVVGNGKTHVYLLYMTKDQGEGLHFDLALPDPKLTAQVHALYPASTDSTCTRTVPLPFSLSRSSSTLSRSPYSHATLYVSHLIESR